MYHIIPITTNLNVHLRAMPFYPSHNEGNALEVRGYFCYISWGAIDLSVMTGANKIIDENGAPKIFNSPTEAFNSVLVALGKDPIN